MKPDFKKTKIIADNILEKYNINHPVVNVFDIAEKEGLEVIAFRAKIGDLDLKETSGILDFENSKIYINQEESPERQAFTVAHELGHYLLGHDPDEYGELLRKDLIKTEEPTIQEKEANSFAANLLVPLKFLKQKMEEYDLRNHDISSLSRLFGVSEKMMEIRLKALDHEK
jgi:Zn-dependent peptidase ImmA (M78 family)